MKAAIASKGTGNVHVYSTLANSQIFTTYRPGGADIPVVDRQVEIVGGAGIATKNLLTPSGMLTTISQDEYDAIRGLPHFSKFVESGHIRVESKKASDIDRIVTDMNPRDPGGPITPADFAATPQDGSVPIPVDQSKLGSGWVLK